MAKQWPRGNFRVHKQLSAPVGSINIPTPKLQRLQPLRFHQTTKPYLLSFHLSQAIADNALQCYYARHPQGPRANTMKLAVVTASPYCEDHVGWEKSGEGME